MRDDSKVRTSIFIMEVWGKDHAVRVYQRSKSVWVAVGEYAGEQLRSTGSSASSAASNWREAAHYKGSRRARGTGRM
jgi:hypothetical protein